MTSTPTAAGTILLTPRVIDQDAFNELAAELREIIEAAESAGRDLLSAHEEAEQCRSESAKAGASLQERLRISARMLKAFQSQIVRTETAIAEMEERHEAGAEMIASVEQRAVAVQSEIDAALESFRERIEGMTDDAVARVEESVNRAEQRGDEIASRLGGLAERAEQMLATIEQAEANAARLVHREADLSAQIEQDFSDLSAASERCEELGRALDQVVAETRDALDEAAARSDQIGLAIGEHAHSAEQSAEAMAARVQEAEAVAQRIALDVQTCEAVESLLERLAPWENLLLRGDAGGDLPDPLLTVIDRLQSRVRRDMGALGEALHHVAEQLTTTTETQEETADGRG